MKTTSPAITTNAPCSTQTPCPKNDINLKAVSEQDVRNIVKQLMKENNKGYLEQDEYKEKDPLYYMNTGELIDNSWENQYSVINTKFWKPYFYEATPPVCMGNNDNCTANPTVMHTPYLELKNFNQTTIKPTQIRQI
jgi:hypothetical protein